MKNPPRPLTNKQRVFVEELITNPKATKTSAYRKAYNISPMTKSTTIYPEASKTTSIPQVKMALANYTELVEGAITKTVSDWKDEEAPRKREIAMQNAQYIHDKIHGRAKQQIDVQTTSLSLSIDLTGKGTPNQEDMLSSDTAPIPPL